MRQMYSSCIWSFLNSSVSLSIHPSIHLLSIHVSIIITHQSLFIIHPSSILYHPYIHPFMFLSSIPIYHSSILCPSSHTYFYLSTHLYPPIHVAIHPCIYEPSLFIIHPSIQPLPYLCFYPSLHHPSSLHHLSMCIYVHQRDMESHQ